MPSGRIRHSVYFSITSEDWPTVKAQLAERMAAYPPAFTPPGREQR
jgi:N-acetyltransferase